MKLTYLNKLYKMLLIQLFLCRNKLFGETNIMIRKPALEIINYIKNADLSQPVNRCGQHLASTNRYSLNITLCIRFVVISVGGGEVGRKREGGGEKREREREREGERIF